MSVKYRLSVRLVTAFLIYTVKQRRLTMRTVLRYIPVVILILVVLNLFGLSESFGVQPWHVIAQKMIRLIAQEIAIIIVLVCFMVACLKLLWWADPNRSDDL